MPKKESTHVDSPEACGKRLREAREAVGLSQRKLAFKGCTPAYISRIEKGERTPSWQLLRELGKRLGASAEYLATGSEADLLKEVFGGQLTDEEIMLLRRLAELLVRLRATDAPDQTDCEEIADLAIALAHELEAVARKAMDLRDR